MSETYLLPGTSNKGSPSFDFFGGLSRELIRVSKVPPDGNKPSSSKNSILANSCLCSFYNLRAVAKVTTFFYKFFIY